MFLTRPNRALCRDLQNYIMCPGLFPIYETATYPRCELQLLLDPTLTYFKLCNIQVSYEQHPYWQAIRSLNGWLYSTTKDIGVEIKCFTKQTINIKINGLGLIRIPLGCELRTNFATHLDLTKLSAKFHDNSSMRLPLPTSLPTQQVESPCHQEGDRALDQQTILNKPETPASSQDVLTPPSHDNKDGLSVIFYM